MNKDRKISAIKTKSNCYEIGKHDITKIVKEHYFIVTSFKIYVNDTIVRILDNEDIIDIRYEEPKKITKLKVDDGIIEVGWWGVTDIVFTSEKGNYGNKMRYYKIYKDGILDEEINKSEVIHVYYEEDKEKKMGKKENDIERLKENIIYVKSLLEWYHPQIEKEKWKLWAEKLKEHEKELHKLLEESEE